MSERPTPGGFIRATCTDEKSEGWIAANKITAFFGIPGQTTRVWVEGGSKPFVVAEQAPVIADRIMAVQRAALRPGDFYKRRVQLLERNQHRFREPERTILVDALANAQFLPDPSGSRYGKTGLDTEDGPAIVRSPTMNFECKLCEWQGLDLAVDEALEYHRRWNSKNGNKPCPGQIQTK